MRVLFLDIDGVLHSGEDAPEQTEYWVWLPVLDGLLRSADDVKIVIHSSWRYHYSVDELRGLLSPLGARVIGVTPRASRWESIRWWMGQHHRSVSSWRVLDDAPALFPSPRPRQLIFCDPATGVTAPDVQAALRDWLDDA